MDDPIWHEFFGSHGIEPVAYHDMRRLTGDLAATPTLMAYLPAANYYYLRHEDSYRPIAMATSAAEGTPSLTSVLAVSASSGIDALDQLREKRLGYINRYCTSSYFGPALLFANRGLLAADVIGELVQVAPWQGQIDALQAGQVDATMVDEDVWHRHPEDADFARVIGRKDGLPTPIVLIHGDAGPELEPELTHLLLSHSPPVTPETLFAGFADFDGGQLERFFADSEPAIRGLDKL